MRRGSADRRGATRTILLISALGCRVAPEEVEGMAEEMGRGVHTFYTLEGALAMRKALDAMTEGHLVIDIAEMPIKCPVAPLEFAFLADYHFRQKGIRDRIESRSSPLHRRVHQANANRILSKVADAKGVKVVRTSRSPVSTRRRSRSHVRRRTVDYDLLCAIPPNLGRPSSTIRAWATGLRDHRSADAEKQRRTASTCSATTRMSRRQAGSSRHFEAETVVENLLREIDGKPPLHTFDGHAELLRRDGPSQGNAARLQLRYRAARRRLPAALRRPVLAARRELPQPHGQARLQVDVLERAARRDTCPRCRSCPRMSFAGRI
jgi:sulfide:quinone oxidoreductase